MMRIIADGIILLLRGLVLNNEMTNPKWPGVHVWVEDVQEFIRAYKAVVP